MGLSDWVAETAGRMRSDGVGPALRQGGYELYRGSWRIAGSRLPLGTNIYDESWDVVVVLDACRVDVLGSVADDYPFLDTVDSVRSVGSHSREWMAKTFAREHADLVAETAYVTGNVFSENTFTGDGEDVARFSPFSPDSWDTVDADDFAVLREVWREAWDDDTSGLPPRAVTDRAIEVARARNPGRLVVHYMQPHLPFIGSAHGYDCSFDDSELAEADINLEALQRGDVSRADFLRGYRANLRLVLEEVELLRRNVDADRLIVTADHGEALGEWGIYGHPIGFLHPAVKRVPWVETTAADTGEHDPEVESTDSATDVEDRLAALGYV